MLVKYLQKTLFIDGSFGQVDLIIGTCHGETNIALPSIRINNTMYAEHVTILSLEKAMLACKINNLGNKLVSIRMEWYIFCYRNCIIKKIKLWCLQTV